VPKDKDCPELFHIPKLNVVRIGTSFYGGCSTSFVLEQ